MTGRTYARAGLAALGVAGYVIGFSASSWPMIVLGVTGGALVITIAALMAHPAPAGGYVIWRGEHGCWHVLRPDGDLYGKGNVHWSQKASAQAMAAHLNEKGEE